MNKKKQVNNITGIDSEQIVLNKFKNWKTDEYAQRTLVKMGYDLKKIKDIVAYIAEDKNGNRKVKLKVNLKAESPKESTTSELVNKLKDKIGGNATTKTILDKSIKLKDKIIGKLKH